MKFDIKYHPLGHEITDLVVVEGNFVHTRGIVINDVGQSLVEDNRVYLYLGSMPARVDRQGTSIFLVSGDYAERHGEPLLLSKNTALFGKPETVWTSRDAPLVSSHG